MSGFSQTLHAWRKTRRLSQLDLAGEAGISSRHLSFLETGRARPSRAMVDRLGEALEMPLAARNQMLTEAGFAPRYAHRPLSDAAMQPVRLAIDHMLTSHAPWPALALDRDWTVLRLNRPAGLMFAPFGVGEGSSLLDLMRNPALPAMVENWPEVARATAARLRTESAARGRVAAFDRLATDLAQAAGPAPAGSAPTGPMLRMLLRLGPQRLSLFTTLAQFGTPEDLTLDDLKIELYFPADDETAAALRNLAAGKDFHDGRDGTAKAGR